MVDQGEMRGKTVDEYDQNTLYEILKQSMEIYFETKKREIPFCLSFAMNMVLFLTNWPFRTQLFSFLTVSYLLLDPPLPGCCFYHFTKTILEPNKMVPTYCPKTGEVETGGLQIPGQSELYQALIQSGLQSRAVI